jgi:hypothetical protein
MNSRARLYQLICGMLLAAVSAAPAMAGSNTWSGVGPPGGLVQKIVYSPKSPTSAYMIGVNGFYRSTDGGMTWTNVKSARAGRQIPWPSR